MYGKMIVDCKRNEVDLLHELEGHRKAEKACLISSSYVLKLASKTTGLFEGLQADQKNELLRFVLANAKVEGERLVYKIKTLFAGVLLYNENQDWLRRLGAF